MSQEKRERQEKMLEVRSEDISEILGTPPGWLVRWGTTVVLLAFSLLVIASWVIRYPDVIRARVEFTTAVPPVEVVARVDGHIEKFLVKENDTIVAGTPLIVLENAANYEDVLLLEKKVWQWERVSTADSLLLLAPINGILRLGELGNDYAAFVQQLEQYNFAKNNRRTATSANVAGVQQQISIRQNAIKSIQDNQRKAATELAEARQIYNKNKTAFDEKVISQNELNPHYDRLLAAERNYNTYREQIMGQQSEISGLQRSIGVVRFDETLDANSTEGRLKSALSALRTSLDRWKQNYLLTAPIPGIVSLNKFYTERQYVKQGEQVMIIAPPTSTQIVGRSRLPIVGSGKVKTNQRVVIRLDNYPYYEFGTLQGRVLNKSNVPKDNAYIVTIGLDSIGGATTSFNKSIEFQQQLQGDADIITEDKRFLQRIVDQIFARAR
jgi:multidrug efflux pump subunit AcrA (membrane-fusion protein)